MRPEPRDATSVVLVHGYHVDALQWQEVVWGRPGEDRLGRVPRAVLLALEHPDPVLLFGTGAAARDGLRESEHTLEFARSRRHELGDLARRVLPPTAAARVGELLHERSRCERTSTTTRTEVAAGFETALSLGARHLTLVSSPTHVARCHQTALSLLDVPEAAEGYAAQWQELTRTWLDRAGGLDGQAEATSR